MEKDKAEELLRLIANDAHPFAAHAALDCVSTVVQEFKVKELEQSTPITRFLQRYGDASEVRKCFVTADDFSIVKTIGSGSFGAVHLARFKPKNEYMALKVMDKARLLSDCLAVQYWVERDIMAKACERSIPWLASLHYALHTPTQLMLAMEFLPGGDLLAIMEHTMSESDVRFYIAECMQALDCLHSLGYVHRDIKPDNVMLDRNGHVKLVDFGVSTAVDHRGRITSTDVCGTMDYMAPEAADAMSGSGYSKLCDYWSAGVVMYEMLLQATPFVEDEDDDDKAIMYRVLKYKDPKDLRFPSDCNLSENCKSLLRGLVAPLEYRLGKDNGIEEVKSHPFFAEINFDSLRDMTPPFIPSVAGDDDTSNFPDDVVVDHPNRGRLLRSNKFTGEQLAFAGFTYSRDLAALLRERTQGGSTALGQEASARASTSENAQNELAETKQQLLQALEDLKQARHQITTKKDDIDDLQTKLADQKKINRKLEDELHEQEQDVKLERHRMHSAREKELHDLRLKVAELEAALTEARSESSKQPSRTSSSASASGGSGPEMSVFKAAMKLKASTAQAKVGRLEAELQRSRFDYETLKTEKEIVENLLEEERQRHRSQTDKLNTTIAATQDAVQKLRDKLQSVEQEHATLQNKHTNIIDELETVKQSMSELEHETANVRSERDSLSKQLDTQRKLAETAASKLRTAMAQPRDGDRGTSDKVTQNLLKRARQENKELQRQLVTAEDKIAQLRSDMDQAVAKAVSDKEETIKQLRDRLHDEEKKTLQLVNQATARADRRWQSVRRRSTLRGEAVSLRAASAIQPLVPELERLLAYSRAVISDHPHPALLLQVPAEGQGSRSISPMPVFQRSPSSQKPDDLLSVHSDRSISPTAAALAAEERQSLKKQAEEAQKKLQGQLQAVRQELDHERELRLAAELQRDKVSEKLSSLTRKQTAKDDATQGSSELQREQHKLEQMLEQERRKRHLAELERDKLKQKADRYQSRYIHLKQLQNLPGSDSSIELDTVKDSTATASSSGATHHAAANHYHHHHHYDQGAAHSRDRSAPSNGPRGRSDNLRAGATEPGRHSTRVAEGRSRAPPDLHIVLEDTSDV